MRRDGVGAAGAAWLIVLAACGSSSQPSAPEQAPIPAPPADAILKESDAGPAKVGVRVWPAKPTLGDSIWVRLEVETDPGVTADLPFDQQALGRFQVLRFAPDHGATHEGGQRYVDTYELAAPMSGKQRIPPLRVVVHAKDDTEILTDEIAIDVGAILAEKTDQALHPARDAVDPYVGGRRWWPLALIGAGLALAIGAGTFGWKLMSGRRRRAAQVSAWDQAIARLAELEARGAPAGDDADAWFVALSGIVRNYVEGRYHLRAPELTTEEFLLEARRIPQLRDEHRDLLGSFLERCDRVKFAGWRPEAGESLELLGVARAFVTETRPIEQPLATERTEGVAA